MTTLPDLNVASFSDSTGVTNALFPLPGGLINSYSAEALDLESGELEEERNDHFVTFETYEVAAGVETVVVRDTAFEDGLLVEDTLDWYAQDDDGNVWYLGEIATNYNYNDDGEFIGTDFGGSWEAGVDGALPGWIMLADPQAGDSYYQEFYESVAEDEGEVIATRLTVDSYDDVVEIKDTSGLDQGAFAFKFFSPGIGLVREEEFSAEYPDEPELVVELENQREVLKEGEVDPNLLGFAGDGSTKTVTFLSEDSDENGAIGAYLFDTATGEIGEGRILFADTEDAKAGDSIEIEVPVGMSLCLFMIADEDNVGIELEDFLEGGLFFGNLLAGNLRDAYDGDPSTTFVPGPAYISDGIAPVVMDADGNLLPIRALHAVGNLGDFNFLNPVAGMNARADESGEFVNGVTVLGFEEAIASTGDYDEDDFDDALIAVSDSALSAEDLGTLLDKIDISRIVGTDDADRLVGTRGDDQLIALDGDDWISGYEGDDVVEAGDGDDHAFGGKGDDEIDGEDGDDQLFGGIGDDEIEGGDGEDLLAGGKGRDVLNGGDGDDILKGCKGSDTLFGDEGDDTLYGGSGSDRLLGGEDNDILIGGADADTFVFNLTAPGDDCILDFELGRDVIEIAGYLGVESFEDLEIQEVEGNAEIDIADGSVTLVGIQVASLGADDFVFV